MHLMFLLSVLGAALAIGVPSGAVAGYVVWTDAARPGFVIDGSIRVQNVPLPDLRRKPKALPEPPPNSGLLQGPLRLKEPPPQGRPELPDLRLPSIGTPFSTEDQTPTGKFTTATEIRAILDATRGSWIGLREYNGQDLLYFSHLLAWRCGLHLIRFAINDGPLQTLRTEPCYSDTAQPNAIKADTILPYLAFPPGSVQSVTVDLLYDDLGQTGERYLRAAIMIP